MFSRQLNTAARLAQRSSRQQFQSVRAFSSQLGPARYAAQSATENAAYKGSDGGQVHEEHEHGHVESHYDPPGGWLWGIKPGEKRESEGWEIPFYTMCVGLVLSVIVYSMKEDTSIQTWALEEARRRLEKEGLLEDTSGK